MSPASKSSCPYYICTTHWPLLSPARKSSFPYYICTTNWPLLSPAPKSSFPYYSCTASWPLLISHLHFAPSTRTVAPDKSNAQSHLRFVPSTRTISAEGCPRQIQNAISPAFRALARTISAEGCAGQIQNALLPPFRALNAHDLRRGLCRTGPKRTLACISNARHARSPQRVAPDRAKAHSRLHFAPLTSTISAEGCAGQGQNALSPTFRALDAHDLRRGLRQTGPKRTLACISRPRHARSSQRVAPDRAKTHSRLHFAPLTCTISAEGCPRQIQNAISPAFRALDTRNLRRGLRRTNPKRTLASISRP